MSAEADTVHPVGGDHKGAWWKGLRQHWAPPGSMARVGVQHLILSASDVEIVRMALTGVGRQVGMRFDLDSCDGELVLLDADVAAHMSPQLIAAFKEGRPTIVVSGMRAGQGLTSQARADHVRQQLWRQLSRIALVRQRWSVRAPAPRPIGHAAPLKAQRVPAVGRSAQRTPTGPTDPAGAVAGASRSHDRRLQGERQVIQQILHGWRHLDAPPFVATYGSDAHLLFDFRTRQVHCDPKAMQFLWAQHELPQPVDGVWPGADASAHPLDLTVWHLGIASERHPMTSAPDGWWHLPLRARAGALAVAERCTRVPSHLDIVRHLCAGPATPSTLRRQGQVSAIDLRRVLQACLMLGLACWAPTDDPTGAA